MSNIYIQEPPTFGKVLLVTTVGDIDIELWAKETPKACRNFIQLGMEGYYNGTTFHRVVKGFIAQGGDPTGTGTGGESIYGEPFKDEFHSRLRFVRRGLVAMANSGKDDNGSQFFFTFAACPELQNKHTIFGKVVGETIYNMLKLEEAETDENEMPLYPQKIIRMEILNNPFPDIVPRTLAPKKEKEKKKKEKSKAGVKNFKLLSFGEEAEEDEEESKEINLSLAGKAKSTHDVLNDPKLSSIPALDKNDDDDLSGDEECNKNVEREKLKAEDIKKKLKRARSKSVERETETVKKDCSSDDDDDDDDEDGEHDFRKEDTEKKKQRLQEIAKEIEALKKDYHKKRKKEVEELPKKEEKTVEDNEILQEYKQNLEKYKGLKSSMPKRGNSRENMTLKLLEGFKKKLQAVKDKAEEDKDVGLIEKEKNDEDEDNESWLAHKLNFEGDTPVLAKDANLKNDDWFEITDPRNAINKRRREKAQTNLKKHL